MLRAHDMPASVRPREDDVQSWWNFGMLSNVSKNLRPPMTTSRTDAVEAALPCLSSTRGAVELDGSGACEQPRWTAATAAAHQPDALAKELRDFNQVYGSFVSKHPHPTDVPDYRLVPPASVTSGCMVSTWEPRDELDCCASFTDDDEVLCTAYERVVWTVAGVHPDSGRVTLVCGGGAGPNGEIRPNKDFEAADWKESWVTGEVSPWAPQVGEVVLYYSSSYADKKAMPSIAQVTGGVLADGQARLRDIRDGYGGVLVRPIINGKRQPTVMLAWHKLQSLGRSVSSFCTLPPDRALTDSYVMAPTDVKEWARPLVYASSPSLLDCAYTCNTSSALRAWFNSVGYRVSSHRPKNGLQGFQMQPSVLQRNSCAGYAPAVPGGETRSQCSRVVDGATSKSLRMPMCSAVQVCSGPGDSSAHGRRRADGDHARAITDGALSTAVARQGGSADRGEFSSGIQSAAERLAATARSAAAGDGLLNAASASTSVSGAACERGSDARSPEAISNVSVSAPLLVKGVDGSAQGSGTTSSLTTLCDPALDAPQQHMPQAEVLSTAAQAGVAAAQAGASGAVAKRRSQGKDTAFAEATLQSAAPQGKDTESAVVAHQSGTLSPALVSLSLPAETSASTADTGSAQGILSAGALALLSATRTGDAGTGLQSRSHAAMEGDSTLDIVVPARLEFDVSSSARGSATLTACRHGSTSPSSARAGVCNSGAPGQVQPTGVLVGCSLRLNIAMATTGLNGCAPDAAVLPEDRGSSAQCSAGVAGSTDPPGGHGQRTMQQISEPPVHCSSAHSPMQFSDAVGDHGSSALSMAPRTAGEHGCCPWSSASETSSGGNSSDLTSTDGIADGSTCVSMQLTAGHHSSGQGTQSAPLISLVEGGGSCEQCSVLRTDEFGGSSIEGCVRVVGVGATLNDEALGHEATVLTAARPMAGDSNTDNVTQSACRGNGAPLLDRLDGTTQQSTPLLDTHGSNTQGLVHLAGCAGGPLWSGQSSMRSCKTDGSGAQGFAQRSNIADGLGSSALGTTPPINCEHEGHAQSSEMPTGPCSRALRPASFSLVNGNAQRCLQPANVIDGRRDATHSTTTPSGGLGQNAQVLAVAVGAAGELGVHMRKMGPFTGTDESSTVPTQGLAQTADIADGDRMARSSKQLPGHVCNARSSAATVGANIQSSVPQTEGISGGAHGFAQHADAGGGNGDGVAGLALPPAGDTTWGGGDIGNDDTAASAGTGNGDLLLQQRVRTALQYQRPQLSNEATGPTTEEAALVPTGGIDDASAPFDPGICSKAYATVPAGMGVISTQSPATTRINDSLSVGARLNDEMQRPLLPLTVQRCTECRTVGLLSSTSNTGTGVASCHSSEGSASFAEVGGSCGVLAPLTAAPNSHDPITEVSNMVIATASPGLVYSSEGGTAVFISTSNGQRSIAGSPSAVECNVEALQLVAVMTTAGACRLAEAVRRKAMVLVLQGTARAGITALRDAQHYSDGEKPKPRIVQVIDYGGWASQPLLHADDQVSVWNPFGHNGHGSECGVRPIFNGQPSAHVVSVKWTHVRLIDMAVTTYCSLPPMETSRPAYAVNPRNLQSWAQPLVYFCTDDSMRSYPQARGDTRASAGQQWGFDSGRRHKCLNKSAHRIMQPQQQQLPQRDTAQRRWQHSASTGNGDSTVLNGGEGISEQWSASCNNICETAVLSSDGSTCVPHSLEGSDVDLAPAPCDVMPAATTHSVCRENICAALAASADIRSVLSNPTGDSGTGMVTRPGVDYDGVRDGFAGVSISMAAQSTQ
ncbi:hypothetical protein JKP88DRAFT_241450 [Tribonema minus]|uniref:Uncharacterized protein n=1 Tax=Tribonema minus TaxID=303371 RepID=A0A836CFH3_9STRA|nr:hypothetical protein JKP88DRAFT_241450 [Tribonema minus]